MLLCLNSAVIAVCCVAVPDAAFCIQLKLTVDHHVYIQLGEKPA